MRHEVLIFFRWTPAFHSFVFKDAVLYYMLLLVRLHIFYAKNCFDNRLQVHHVKVGVYVRPVCTQYPNHKCTVRGWGRRGYESWYGNIRQEPFTGLVPSVRVRNPRSLGFHTTSCSWGLCRAIDLSIFVISCCSGCRNVKTSAYSTTCCSWGLSRVTDLSIFVISCCSGCRSVRT